MSILIVEDNPVSMKILELNIKKHGYSTISAKNGREALECLGRHLDIQLVLTDIMMPEMDGLEMLCIMKQKPELRDLPVII